MGATREGEHLAETALAVSILDSRGPLKLHVSFCLEAGWTVLFGPSGSGKSTILRTIAGLERPSVAQISLKGEALTDTARALAVPAYRRGVRMVAQRPGLFPNKNVRDNILFGCTDPARLLDVADLCRIRRLMERKVKELSGGERQRVALARTLAADGAKCLLLDEPFSGLDGELRDEILAELRLWLAPQRIPILLVTHDLGEVLTSEAEVLRLRDGEIIAQGHAEEVLASELEHLRGRLEMGVKRR